MVALAIFGPLPEAVQALELISQFYAIGMPALVVFGVGCFLASR